MPMSHGYSYIIKAECSLTAWPKFCLLKLETSQMLRAFLFKDVFCCLGAVKKIVTNNSTSFVAALD
ncbi:hypothetical protein CY34DRAFT_96308 [Suillus luteus UH-Slu-Lm8-n1]|uniref:Uncharacterized protein n=1 Tax=Suillus luteus UH-Slu-Lm8-n1 TaxID=930992 RepID=A0A0D0A0G5_9AGAM|nr:hypothetical protein CY34DRAFT_96308 [Suillus luteus UH-Slu-Lm8-n1]